MVESGSALKNVASPVFWDVFEIEARLCELAASVHGGRRLEPTQDFFENGFDRCARSNLLVSPS